MDSVTVETVTDAGWFPMRFDGVRQLYQFVQVPAEMHRAITFLNDLQANDRETRFVSRLDAAEIPVLETPLHMILHSGLGGSTLLARALGQAGAVTTLKEPPIFNDIVAFGLRGAAAEDQRTLLSEAARLLSRPFSPGEAIVVKMSSIGNGLVSGIAHDRLQSQVLCLQTPLELMLASLASRGAEGRLGGRRLFTGMRNAGMIAAASAEDQSDLQLTALAWLSIQKMMSDAAAAFGPERVRSVMSEQLIAEPRRTLSSIAAHFRLNLDVDARLVSGVFSRHAKTGQPFDAKDRVRRLDAALSEHGREIGAVVDWARKVADANEIAWDPPYPLLD